MVPHSPQTGYVWSGVSVFDWVGGKRGERKAKDSPGNIRRYGICKFTQLIIDLFKECMSNKYNLNESIYLRNCEALRLIKALYSITIKYQVNKKNTVTTACRLTLNDHGVQVDFYGKRWSFRCPFLGLQSTVRT